DPPFNFNIGLNSILSGGSGFNNIGDIYAFNPQPEPPGFSGIVMNAPVHATLDPTQGDNVMNFEFFHDPPSERSAIVVELNSSVDINMIGGKGSEMMNLFIGSGSGIAPCIMPQGSVNAMLQSGAGNDTIVADMNFDSDSLGRVTAQVFAGGGDDDA